MGLSSSTLGGEVGTEDVELATAAEEVPEMVSDAVGRAVNFVCCEELMNPSFPPSSGRFTESMLVLLASLSPVVGIEMLLLLPMLPLPLLLNGLIFPLELYDAPTATMANTKTPKMNAAEKTVKHFDF